MATPEKKPVGGKTAAPVPAGSVPGEAANPAAASSAAQTAARHGGLPGGKPRQDGLVPGSVEAAAADRAKDAKRKQAARAVAAKLQPEPPALPSAGVAGASTAPAGSQSPGAAPGQPGPPLVPWDAQLIKPLLEKMIEAAEKGRLAKFAVKCQQLGDMPQLIKEIEQDAHMPAEAKAMLSVSLPRCAAKWLNKSGLSAEYQDEIVVVTACVLIWSHDRKADQRLAKLLAELNKTKELQSRGPGGNGQQIFGAEQMAARPAPQPAPQRAAAPAVSTVVTAQPIPAARPEPAGATPVFALGGDQTIATLNPTGMKQ